MGGSREQGTVTSSGTCRDYSHVEAPRDDHVHIRFTGPFQGQLVTWDARIVTLEHEHRLLQAARQPVKIPELRKFIEVERADGGIWILRIGLDVDCIDEAVIRNAMIMTRQYRRLRPGRHEYGEPWSPPEQP